MKGRGVSSLTSLFLPLSHLLSMAPSSPPFPLFALPSFPRNLPLANSGVTSGSCRELRETLVRAFLPVLAMHQFPGVLFDFLEMGTQIFLKCRAGGPLRWPRKNQPDQGRPCDGGGGGGRACTDANRRWEQRLVGELQGQSAPDRKQVPGGGV